MGHSAEFLRVVDEARRKIKETDVPGVKERLARGEKLELVDVREDSEWEKGRIPGSRHIGRGVLERDIEATLPNKDAEIILYCGGGFRSALAAESVQKMGYRRVLSMDAALLCAAARASGVEPERVRPYDEPVLIASPQKAWLKIYPVTSIKESWRLDIEVKSLEKGLPKVLDAFTKAGAALTQPRELFIRSETEKSQQLSYRLSIPGARGLLKPLKKLGKLAEPVIRPEVEPGLGARRRASGASPEG
ncbi:MAG: hypothetical protein FD126_3812 [Elusimicrobia bacterium]|nr:MAG: hypothetical protein FD126_3812 [Elusimicrobiota bacterium]